MSLLFDVPQEDTPRKRARKTIKIAQNDAHRDDNRAIYKAEPPPKAIKALGTLDDGVECADSTCRGTAHDILHEEHGEWLVQCCFCNTAQWVPVVAGHLKPKEAEFIFRDGRFSGLSIDEAVALPRGLEYVVWAAKEHKRPAVKAACETWLAKNRTAR